MRWGTLVPRSSAGSAFTTITSTSATAWSQSECGGVTRCMHNAPCAECLSAINATPGFPHIQAEYNNPCTHECQHQSLQSSDQRRVLSSAAVDGVVLSDRHPSWHPLLSTARAERRWRVPRRVRNGGEPLPRSRVHLLSRLLLPAVHCCALQGAVCASHALQRSMAHCFFTIHRARVP